MTGKTTDDAHAYMGGAVWRWEYLSGALSGYVLVLAMHGGRDRYALTNDPRRPGFGTVGRNRKGAIQYEFTTAELRDYLSGPRWHYVGRACDLFSEGTVTPVAALYERAVMVRRRTA
jgi:hypothetical protein